MVSGFLAASLIFLTLPWFPAGYSSSRQGDNLEQSFPKISHNPYTCKDGNLTGFAQILHA
jgi:hypothetical protein